MFSIDRDRGKGVANLNIMTASDKAEPKKKKVFGSPFAQIRGRTTM